MCGIAGAVALQGQVDPEWVRGMVDAQRHRGPDGEGMWADDRCVLGHRRLAVIDLSDAGCQPMTNEDGTVRVTFNGEIYNFRSLRDELSALGHRFCTQTDTEVIVHGYEQWGAECLHRLRGMFAFAVWDQRRRCLLLARDRLGKKPLFYAHTDDRFLFASELQALLAGPGVARDVDLEALDAYLSWGYIPAPKTGFRSISKLPPAHYLVLDTAGTAATAVEQRRYWSLAYAPKLRLSEADAAERLRELMTEAVRLRMISDVPLGAFLSGGIDSSVVVGLMSQLSAEPVKTFSIGLEEPSFNELEHARRIAERCGTDHHEFVVRPDTAAVLPQLVRHYGEPYADSSAIPTFYVSQLARRHVTVALNGDGGDESFAGYKRYRANQLAERLARIPGGRAAVATLKGRLPHSIDPRNHLQRVDRLLTRPMAARYAKWSSYFDEEDKAVLCTDQFRDQVQGQRPADWFESLFVETRGLDPADAGMAVDVQSYLPYDLMVKVDIASMANSLESRSPFLDTEVMEFAARLPVHLKVRRGHTKYLVTRAFADLLPEENVRRRKMGFGVPVGQWFRGPLRELLRDCLLSSQSTARGYFRPVEVGRLVDAHLDGRDHTPLLWTLLMLELWHREMVDPPGPLSGRPSGRTAERPVGPSVIPSTTA